MVSVVFLFTHLQGSRITFIALAPWKIPFSTAACWPGPWRRNVAVPMEVDTFHCWPSGSGSFLATIAVVTLWSLQCNAVFCFGEIGFWKHRKGDDAKDLGWQRWCYGRVEKRWVLPSLRGVLPWPVPLEERQEQQPDVTCVSQDPLVVTPTNSRGVGAGCGWALRKAAGTPLLCQRGQCFPSLLCWVCAKYLLFANQSLLFRTTKMEELKKVVKLKERSPQRPGSVVGADSDSEWAQRGFSRSSVI